MASNSVHIFEACFVQATGFSNKVYVLVPIEPRKQPLWYISFEWKTYTSCS